MPILDLLKNKVETQWLVFGVDVVISVAIMYAIYWVAGLLGFDLGEL